MPSPRTLVIWTLFLVMEVLAFFALVITVLPTVDIWLLMAGAVSGLAAASLLATFGPGDAANRVLLVLGGLATAALALAPGGSAGRLAVAALLILVMYARGVATAANRIGYDDISARFGMGYGLLFLGLFIALATGELYRHSTWQELALLGVVYTIVAALALGIARLESTRTPAAGRAAAASLGVQAALLLLLALAALQFFALDLAGAAWHLTRPIFDVMGAAIFNFFLLFKGVFDHFVNLLRPPARPAPVRQPPRVGTPTPHRIAIHGGAGNGEAIALGLLAAAGAIILGVTLYLVWRLAPRAATQRPASGFKEMRAWLRPPRELWRVLLAWLRGMLRQTSAGAIQAAHRARRRLVGEYPADPVRRLYVLLLRRAAAAGLPRAPQVTPAEFQGQLAARWPDASFHVAVLTDAYVRRRYGEATFDPQTVAQLQQHWHHIRALVRVPRLTAQPPRRGSAAPEPRRRLALPEFATGQEAYNLRHTVLPAVAGVAIAVAMIVLLLALLALASHFAMAPGLPA